MSRNYDIVQKRKVSNHFAQACSTSWYSSETVCTVLKLYNGSILFDYMSGVQFWNCTGNGADHQYYMSVNLCRWAMRPHAADLKLCSRAIRPHAADLKLCFWAISPHVADLKLFCWAIRPHMADIKLCSRVISPHAADLKLFCWAIRPHAADLKLWFLSISPHVADLKLFCWAIVARSAPATSPPKIRPGRHTNHTNCHT
jgi:hypothetical protein